MTSLTTALLVAVAGGAGSAARFVVDGEVTARRPDFPWGTAAVNVLGSLLLGVVAGSVLFGAASGDLMAIAGVGFCGGFTTFSTASVDAVRLVRARRGVAAVAALAGVLAAALVAGAAGLAVGSAL